MKKLVNFLIVPALISLFSVQVLADDVYATSAQVTIVNKSQYIIGPGTYTPLTYYVSLPFPTIPLGGIGSFTYSVKPTSTEKKTSTVNAASTGTNTVFYGASDGTTVDAANGCTFSYSAKNCTIPTPPKGVGVFAGSCNVCSSNYDQSNNSCNFTFGAMGC